MPREANIEVFNGIINTGVSYFTSPEFYEPLGRGDRVVLQGIVDAAPALAGAETVTVEYQTTNDPSASGTSSVNTWHTVSSMTLSIIVTSATDVPNSKMSVNGNTDPLGAFGRVKLTVGSGNGWAVRVLACLRTGV